MSDDDIIPAIELTQWQEGRVLNADDIKTLMRFLREVDEDEEQHLHVFEQAEESILIEIGGEELLKTWQNRQQHSVAEAVQKALAKYYAKLAEKRSTAT